MELTATAASALERLDRYVRAHDYAGPDPYDALRSPLARKLEHPRARQILVQLVRRAPLNVRPALRVGDTKMSKGLALFCSGLARAPWLPDAGERVTALADELRRRATHGAWGYEFDVQTRWAYYAAGSPNMIATSFVIEAGHDSGERTWTAQTLSWFEERMLHPDGFIRYVPGSDRLIHNASLLGARALHRISPGHPGIDAAVHRTLSAQQPDGLWPYGEGPGLGWVDNFHTAYVLLALASLPDHGGEVGRALDIGVRAWVTRCFDRDGAPRYYADRAGPMDVHNVATAVFTLEALSQRHPECSRILDGALRHLLRLQRGDGAFVARRGAPAFMRWNQAHAFLALAATSAGAGDQDR